jgi:hypothetical protein
LYYDFNHKEIIHISVLYLYYRVEYFYARNLTQALQNFEKNRG